MRRQIAVDGDPKSAIVSPWEVHAELDAAVMEAYGFSAEKDLLAQILELNLEVAKRIEAGEKVVAPGIPPGYPKAKELVSEDCIQPREDWLLGKG
jgi:hypothetical protein